MKLVRLSNRLRRMVTFEIPPSCGVDAQDPQKVARMLRSVDPIEGKMKSTLTVEQRAFPTTITLCARGTPGDSVDGLPEGVLRAPSIQSSLRRRPTELVVETYGAPDLSTVIEEN